MMREMLIRSAAEQLPPPGGGATGTRFAELFDLGVRDLELARLAEAHHDAHAIAAEAGAELVPGALYGVWAASGPDPLLIRSAASGDGWDVVGSVPWCTGVGILDRALVTARFPDDSSVGPVLIDLAVREGTEQATGTPWAAGAFATTNTATMQFDLTIGADRMVGDVGSYLTRPGFWHGAIGVAACWAGGMRGLFDLHRARWKRTDEHSLAHLGSAFAGVRAMHAVLVAAAAEIDASPFDGRAAEARARSVRHTIERLCTAAMDDLAVGAGPEPMAFDNEIIDRTHQLQLFIRQCHGERDLAPLGQYIVDTRI